MLFHQQTNESLFVTLISIEYGTDFDFLFFGHVSSIFNSLIGITSFGR